MTTRSEFISVAREYLNTPWVHQGRLKGLGVDCCGFIAEVALESGATNDIEFERDYRRDENGERMIALLNDYLDLVPKVEDAQPGDVLALCDEQVKHPNIPRHLIILTELEPYWKGIHASEHGVVEHRLDIRFKERIHSVWRVKGIQD